MTPQLLSYFADLETVKSTVSAFSMLILLSIENTIKQSLFVPFKVHLLIFVLNSKNTEYHTFLLIFIVFSTPHLQNLDTYIFWCVPTLL